MSPGELGRKRSSLHLSLARRIVALAAEQGWPAGYHLRETEIARAFEVSRTPARAALRLLAEQGVAEARANQGFFLISEHAELTAAEQSLPAAREENVIHAILRDREAGRLPEHLIETELQETYRIGPSGLKKVLLQLAEEPIADREG